MTLTGRGPFRRAATLNDTSAMKSATAAALLLVLAACAPAAEPEPEMASQETSAMDTPSMEPPAGAVRHVVAFKFTPEATPEQIQQVTDSLRVLKDRIPGILAFEHGVNHSPEGKSQGSDHIYTLTFESPAARDVYLPHPEHAAFGQFLRGSGIFEDVFVVDYDPLP